MLQRIPNENEELRHEDDEKQVVVANLTDERPDLWLQFLVANFTSRFNIPLTQARSLLNLQRMIVSTVIKRNLTLENFKGVPTTARTAYQNLGAWSTEAGFVVYACCSNHHLVDFLARIKSWFDQFCATKACSTNDSPAVQRLSVGCRS